MRPGFAARMGSLVVLTAIVCACQSGGPTGPQPTSAAATQGASNAAATPAGVATPARPASGAPTAAAWTVTLTGPMTGSGTHSGAGLVTCTLIDGGNGGSSLTASMVDLAAPFGELTDWQMNVQPGQSRTAASSRRTGPAGTTDPVSQRMAIEGADIRLAGPRTVAL